MLTPEQVQQYRDQYKIAPLAGSPAPKESLTGHNLLGYIKGNTEPAPEPTKPTIAEKIGSFTGGTKIAQGLGQAIAQPKIASSIAQNQQQQMDVQTALLQRIKEKESRGEDASRLKGALEDLGFSIEKAGREATGLLNPNQLTGKQIAGDALQLVTTAAGNTLISGTKAGKIITNQPIIPGAAELAGKVTGGGVGIVKGAAQGLLAGSGAGAAFGGASGVAQGLQEDKSTGDIAKQGLKGAVLGAITGGLLGGTTGAISGGIKSYQVKKANQDFIDKMITPPTDKGKVALTAIKTGKVKEGSGILGERDFSGALPDFNKIKESVAKVPGISPKNSNLENLNAIHDAIGTTAEDLKTKLASNQSSFTPNEFNKYMNGVKQSLAENPAIVGDAEKSANKILAKFNSLIKENGYTPSGLLESRKQLDSWIGGQKGNVFNPSSENAVSMALRAIRQGGNNFLAEKVPDVAIKEMLSHQSNLYHAIDTMAPKALKEGASFAQRLIGAIRAHPVGSVLGATALGTAGTAMVNKVTGL